MKTVRCKFRCQSVIKNECGGGTIGYVTKFYAVTDGSPENELFFQFTPSGNLDIGTHKEDNFVPGKEYHIDITPA